MLLDGRISCQNVVVGLVKWVDGCKDDIVVN